MPSAPTVSAKPAAADHEILFQKWFKSVGPRTYAAQLKKAGNGNHYLVLTEGKRNDKTGEVRKTRLFLFSEDFVEFFRMLHDTAVFVREHPVPAEVKQKRERFWAKDRAGGSAKPGRRQPFRSRRPSPQVAAEGSPVRRTPASASRD